MGVLQKEVGHRAVGEDNPKGSDLYTTGKKDCASVSIGNLLIF